MYPLLSLDEAFLHSQHARPNRRALILLIQDSHSSYWWGGNVDKWRPSPTIFPSAATAEQCKRLVQRFRCNGGKAGMLLMHANGSLGAVMLGAESKEEVVRWLLDTAGAVIVAAPSAVTLMAHSPAMQQRELRLPA